MFYLVEMQSAMSISKKAAARAAARKNPDVRKREQAANSVARADARTLPQVREKEQSADTAARADARTLSQVRDKEQSANTAARAAARAAFVSQQSCCSYAGYGFSADSGAARRF